MVPEIREISSAAVGKNLRVLRSDGWVYLTYPDLATLSLNLVRLSCPSPAASDGDPDRPLPAADLRVEGTTYLDRISETPEIGEGFGAAPLAVREGLLNLFYSDREREGAPVLKWVSGVPHEDRWWIDILPYPGEPLAVVASEQGDLELYLLSDQALVRRSVVREDVQELLRPCAPAPEVCVLQSPQRSGITVFDRASQRLYAVLRGPEGADRAEPVYTAGEAHHAIVHDGLLCVLVFVPGESSLLLLEEKPASNPRAFAATPVTLCEGTTSVFLGYWEGRPFFLYNQRVVDREGSPVYQLTLLSATRTEAGESAYRPTAVLELPEPVRRFVVSPAGSRLYVFFVQDTLKMLSLDLEAVNSE
ncbi:MAG: hypothetical protein JW820_03115 [Spirochaetales bacterium]|nr:hypothetical protein [Spirochaetales bacterium]